MLALFVFVITIILQFITSYLDSVFFSIFIGVAALTSFVIATIGLIFSIQGWRESISMEQIVGITINGVFFVIFIFIIAEVLFT